MSNLQTRLQQAADEAARLGRTSGPDAVIRRGRQRRRRLIGGTASLVVLMLVAGGLGTGRLASRQSPLAPAPTTAPTATSVTRIPAAVTKPVKLDVQVHLGPAGFPDRFGMASDLTTVMGEVRRRHLPGPDVSQVRMWAQVLGKTWVLAAKEPLPEKNWICWSDGLWDKRGAALFGGHGGSRTGSSCSKPASWPAPSLARANWRWWVAPSPDKRSGCGSCSATDPRSTLCPWRSDPNSRSSSTPCSTSSRQRRPGCQNAWSPTIRPAAASPSAGQPPARATSVIVPKAPPSHHDGGTLQSISTLVCPTPVSAPTTRSCSTAPLGGVERPRRVVRFRAIDRSARLRWGGWRDGPGHTREGPLVRPLPG
jgi:hypothetical protein